MIRTLRRVAAAMCVAGCVMAGASPQARAADLKIGMSSPPTSMDPHFYNLFSNINVSEHMFECLVKMDADSHIIPGLAASWKMVNNLTWEFKLRPGVKFHDGSELTAGRSSDHATSSAVSSLPS